MTEVFINDIALDLDPLQKVAITKQINDIGDLETRQSDFTNRFKALRTHKNDKALESLVKVFSGSLLAYRNNNGLIRSDGLDVARQALATVVEVTEEAYSLAFYGGVLTFFDAIAGKDLSDLDLSAHDHLWSRGNAAGSQGNTTGYIYAICNYGGLGDPNFGVRDIDVRGMVFSIFVQTVVDKIFSEAGFTKSGAIFSDVQYTKMLLPFSNGAFSIQEDEDFSASKTVGQGPFTVVAGETKITFPIEVFDEGANYDGVDDYTTPRDMTAKITVKMNITITGLAADTVQLLIKVGSHIPTRTLITANVTTVDFDIAVDDNLPNAAVCNVTINKLGTADTVMLTVHSGSFEMKAIPTLPLNTLGGSVGKVYVSENMPEMSQCDFLAGIMKMFALLPTVKPEAPLEVEFKPFQQVFDNAAIAIDWSRKLDLTREIKQEFTPKSYGKNSHLAYKDDLTDNLPNAGRGTFVIDDDTLEDNNNVVTVPFSPSPSVDRLIDVTSVTMADISRFTRTVPDPTSRTNNPYKLDKAISLRITRVTNGKSVV